MQSLDKNLLKFLVFTFVILSILHICYAVYAQRGFYLDGAFWFVSVLNNLSAGTFPFVYDENHTRNFAVCLSQLPMVLAYGLFHIKSKIFLSYMFSLPLFVLPLIFMYWNYNLTKRTKQYGILFWSIFSYCVVSLVIQIWSIAENIIASQIYFLLLNYLLAKIEYNKWDKTGIVFLLIMMFEIYEHTIIIGLLFFSVMLYFVFKEKNRCGIKIVIGIVSALASLYNLVFCLNNISEHSDFRRFLIESTDYWRITGEFILFISAVTVCLLIFNLITRKYGNKIFSIFNFAQVFLYAYLFYYMYSHIDKFLAPVVEGHVKTLPCYVDVLVILGIIIYHFLKFPPQTELIKKCLIPVLLCGITLTSWQMVNTYYWNKNLKYFMTELKNYSQAVYVPEKHEVLSSFNNKDLRRYIWHCVYITTAIALDNEYKIKTLPIHYQKEYEIGNLTYYEFIYPKLENGILNIPFNTEINIKNEFWDLSEFADALEKYKK